MRREVSHRLIGLFVVFAIALFVVFVSLLGIGKYFREVKYYVMYFDESLNGLEIGAPLRFRGVDVGEVTDIIVEYNHDTHKIKMPVIVTIEPKSVIEIGQPQSKYKKGQIIEALIQQGLRARLATESMLTGSRYISLDMEPKEPLKLVGTPNTYPEFPTIKAPPEKLSDIISSTRNTLASIEKFVTSEKLNQSIDDFSEMMKAGKDTMLRTKEVAKTAQQTLEVTKQTMETGKSAVDDGRRLINRVDRYIEPLAIKLLKSLQQLPDTINTIRVFVDYLSRHPEALLQGKGTGHGR